MKETFYWKDENGEPKEYPISEVGKVIFGVEQGKEGETVTQPTIVHGVLPKQVFSEGRVQEELAKARKVSFEK